MTQQTIGRYEIRDELGEGGMGTVYLAYDPSLEREIALKVLQPQLFMQDPEYSARFEREVKTVAALQHGSIVPLYEYGEDGEWIYFAMPLMRGGTLRERIEKGPLTLEEANQVVQRIGSALAKAHRQGIVHRDLKPGNILFDEDGDAYLSDFGIVKIDDPVGLKTKTGQSLGTPQYMSPEQLDGKTIDGRSDIYSLGIILYEMLTGSKPYDHESTARIIIMQITAPVPDILAASPDLPPQLQEIIQKAMAKEPEDRYITANQMTKALQDVVNAQSVAASQPPIIKPGPEPQSTPPPTPEASEEITVRDKGKTAELSTKPQEISVTPIREVPRPMTTGQPTSSQTEQDKKKRPVVVTILVILAVLAGLYPFISFVLAFLGIH